MRERFLRRRNGCVAAVFLLTILANAIGEEMFRFQSWSVQYHFGIFGVYAIVALGIGIVALFAAACWYAARAKGWHGAIGLAFMLFGLLTYLGCALYMLFINANLPWSLDNPPRVHDPRLPFLPWSAALIAALFLKGLPVKPVKDNPSHA